MFALKHPIYLSILFHFHCYSVQILITLYLAFYTSLWLIFLLQLSLTLNIYLSITSKSCTLFCYLLYQIYIIVLQQVLSNIEDTAYLILDSLIYTTDLRGIKNQQQPELRYLAKIPFEKQFEELRRLNLARIGIWLLISKGLSWKN